MLKPRVDSPCLFQSLSTKEYEEVHLGVLKQDALLLLVLMTTPKKEHVRPDLKEQFSTLASPGCAGAGGPDKLRKRVCAPSGRLPSLPCCLLF